MTLVRIHHPPSGPRLYLFGARVHHGATGCAVAVAGLALGHRPLLAVGLALILHDWHDRHDWFRNEKAHACSSMS